MKPKKRHLEFYKTHVKTGTIPGLGLCNCARDNKFINKKLLDIMSPQSILELPYKYHQYGLDYANRSIFWEYDGKIMKLCDMLGVEWDSKLMKDMQTDFSPLRQTIILFMAAMNGEL